MPPRAPLSRIAVLDDYGDVVLRSADWSGLPVTIFRDPLADPAASLAAFDTLVLFRERSALPAELIARLPALRLVVTAGMRNRVLDMAACEARGIAVCGTASSAAPTVELTWALLLALARRLPQEDAALRAGRWQTSLGMGLEGATLGVLGLGRIGTRVAALGRAFGMEVLAWSRNLTEATAAACGAVRVEKHDLLARADVVTLHLGLGPESRHTLAAAEFARMKPGALLVNTARAGLVDQDALIAALREGRLGGAAIDVFDREPLPPAHPLLAAPNTILTPHLGYVTAQNCRSYFEGAAACLRAWGAGAPLPLPLNPAAETI